MARPLVRRNVDYRRLLVASAISNLGDGVSALAFPWLATLLTRDPMLIAAIGFAARLPLFLFPLPAGVVTDRGNRQRIMVGCDLLRLALTFGIVVLALSVPPHPEAHALPYIAALAVLAFLLGSAEVLRDNAAQTALPSVVDAADLESANGQLWSIEEVMRAFVGPPLAGLLIAWSVALPFGLDAVSFGVSAALVWLVTLRPRPTREARRPFLHELRQGIAWLWQHPALLRLALMLGVLNGLNAATAAMLVLYVREVLGLGATGFGLLMAVGAAGGVTGGFVAPMVVRWLGTSRTLHAALALFALGPALIAVAPGAGLVGLGLFVYALGGIGWNIVTVSFRQRTIPDALLGRVNSVYRFLGLGLVPLGALAGGLIVAAFQPALGQHIALRLPFAIEAAGALMLMVYGLFALRLPSP
jgi:MFS family permease